MMGRKGGRARTSRIGERRRSWCRVDQRLGPCDMPARRQAEGCKSSLECLTREPPMVLKVALADIGAEESLLAEARLVAEARDLAVHLEALQRGAEAEAERRLDKPLPGARDGLIGSR